MLQLLVAGAFAFATTNNSAAQFALSLPHATVVVSSYNQTFLTPLAKLQKDATASAIENIDRNNTILAFGDAEAGHSAQPIPTKADEQVLMSVNPTPTMQVNLPTPTPTEEIRVQPQITPAGNFDAVYQAAASQFGIPWQILYGLHLTESGCRDGYIMSGYGTGARGPMQFMPGTFEMYKIDGHPNIDSAVDSIYAAANYIAKHGSIQNALASYGGDTAGILAAAKSRGYNE